MKRGKEISPHFSTLSLSVFLQQGRGIVLEEHPIGHELLMTRHLLLHKQIEMFKTLFFLDPDYFKHLFNVFEAGVLVS